MSNNIGKRRLYPTSESRLYQKVTCLKLQTGRTEEERTQRNKISELTITIVWKRQNKVLNLRSWKGEERKMLRRDINRYI